MSAAVVAVLVVALVDLLIPVLRERLAADAGELVLAGWPTVLLGPATRYLGSLALADGDLDAAAEHLSRAAVEAQASPPALARILTDQAVTVSRRGGPTAASRAGELLRQADAIARRLHMTALQAHLATL